VALVLHILHRAGDQGELTEEVDAEGRVSDVHVIGSDVNERAEAEQRLCGDLGLAAAHMLLAKKQLPADAARVDCVWIDLRVLRGCQHLECLAPQRLAITTAMRLMPDAARVFSSSQQMPPAPTHSTAASPTLKPA
jgi:hypothetical protein